MTAMWDQDERAQTATGVTRITTMNPTWTHWAGDSLRSRTCLWRGHPPETGGSKDAEEGQAGPVAAWVAGDHRSGSPRNFPMFPQLCVKIRGGSLSILPKKGQSSEKQADTCLCLSNCSLTRSHHPSWPFMSSQSHLAGRGKSLWSSLHPTPIPPRLVPRSLAQRLGPDAPHRALAALQREFSCQWDGEAALLHVPRAELTWGCGTWPMRSCRMRCGCVAFPNAAPP
jgi:hypothetical protein